jgi:hypothetical protein
MLTIFSCPKAFAGHNAVIQRNALKNWKALGLHVFLLGDDEGVAEAAGEYDCAHVPALARTAWGTPLLSDIFSRSREAASTPLLCYVNADVLFTEKLLPVAVGAHRRFARFLLTGRRWNADISGSLEFSGDWPQTLEDIRARAVLSGSAAMDYFIFPRDMPMPMPPLVIGRPAWDNWLFWDARRRGIATIDATRGLPVIHQNHDYDHVPGRVGLTWEGSPEAEYNRNIIRATAPDFFPDIFKTVTYAQWRLSPTLSMQRNLSYKKLWQTCSNYVSGFFKPRPGNDQNQQKLETIDS